MAMYEYRCKKCGHEFERMETLSEHQRRKQQHRQKPACPKCKSHAVEQIPAAFQAVTSRKS